MRLSEFNYDYPLELVAQEAIEPRDASRLMRLNRVSGSSSHHIFKDLPQFFQKGDVLVLNNTKVIPARVFAKKPSGGKVEVLFLKPQNAQRWECLVSPVKNLKSGSSILFDFKGEACEAKLVENISKIKLLEFPEGFSVRALMEAEGAAPLPPYIRRSSARKEDRSRYQAIFAEREGAVAAPTASLHFTQAVMNALHEKGVEVLYITLHVGLGTFEPIQSEEIADHVMQIEPYEISGEVLVAIQKAKQENRKITAVGTTVVRTLESFFADPQARADCMQQTQLFITPGYEFKVVDRFLTNFHQPASTPLLLTSAFAGKGFLKQAYSEAIQQKYRLFSYGDCMLID